MTFTNEMKLGDVSDTLELLEFIEWIKCDQEQWFYEHFKDYTNVYRSLHKNGKSGHLTRSYFW